MALPLANNSRKKRPPEKKKNNNDGDMMPTTAPGSSAATLHMRNFAATSMEQNKTDWDSESDHFQPMGLSDQEGWDDDDCVDLGDFLAVADEPPTIEHGHMERADSSAKAPTSNTHPPDPTHSSMPDSSPVADKDMAAPDPDRDEDTKEGEKTELVDMVVEEEYEEELDYEDDGPTDKQPADISGYEAKRPGIWKQLGEPVDGHASTDTETGETAAMMENVLGIQSPEGTHGTDEKAEGSRSRHSDRQHTVLSDDCCRSRGYSSDSSQSSSHLTGSKTSKRHLECKTGGSSSTKMSDRLDIPEIATPHQSPQQKQLKMMDLEAQSVTPAPTENESLLQPGCHLSSQVVRVQIAEQGVLHSTVQHTEVRMEAVNDPPRSLSPLARTRRSSDTGLCP